jgi:hypothetical protein
MPTNWTASPARSPRSSSDRSRGNPQPRSPHRRHAAQLVRIHPGLRRVSGRDGRRATAVTVISDRRRGPGTLGSPGRYRVRDPHRCDLLRVPHLDPVDLAPASGEQLLLALRPHQHSSSASVSGAGLVPKTGVTSTVGGLFRPWAASSCITSRSVAPAWRTASAAASPALADWGRNLAGSSI